MLATIHFLNVLLPVLYLAGFLVYYLDFTKDVKGLNNTKRIFLFVTLVLHVFYLFARTVEFNHPPITNKFEIFTVLAFSIMCSYFLLELLTDIRNTGMFIIIFAFFFQLFSSMFIEDLIEVQEVLRNRLLGIHVISAMLGYSGFTISTVYGLLYLMLYKSIKISKFGLMFNRLPSLETLEKLSFNSLIIGFILLTIAIIIGIIWLPSAFPNFSYLDPKLVVTGVVWIIYGLVIAAKYSGFWYGRKLIIFSQIGFAVAILSVIATIVFKDSFHSFY
jgi:ABC-type transport system involved in cytochrome c biogenesis permease subunit